MILLGKKSTFLRSSPLSKIILKNHWIELKFGKDVFRRHELDIGIFKQVKLVTKKKKKNLKKNNIYLKTIGHIAGFVLVLSVHLPTLLCVYNLSDK